MKMTAFKLLAWHISVILFMMLSISSCNQANELLSTKSVVDQKKQSFNNEDLSRITKNQLDQSIQNWNQYFGAQVRAIDYNVTGMINSEDEMTRLKNEIISLDAWIPSGPLYKPEQVTAIMFREYADQIKAIESVSNLLDTTLAVGQQVVQINWRKGATQFSSICIVGEEGIVYDNMLTNVAIMEEPDEEPEFVEYKDSNAKISLTAYGWVMTVYHAKWLWGQTRGKGKVTVYAYCNGSSISTAHNTYNTSAYFSVGSCLLKARTIQNSPCHKVQHTWGWATPTGSVSFDSNKFKVNVGGVGSKGNGGGTFGACCGHYI